jgi:cytochrome c peroxidase
MILSLFLVSGKNGAWHKITQRIQNNPSYVGYFKKSFAYIKKDTDIKFTDIANTIAEFTTYEWQAIGSPFDAYLQGDNKALTALEIQGVILFYGKANCSSCHSGALQTDHQFHAIAMPQFGPGKVARFESRKQDTGRMRVTGNSQDAYKFRTPSLRNIALTSPYGHDGAFKTLAEIIKHHLDPIKSLRNFDYSTMTIISSKGLGELAMVTPQESENIARANQLKPMKLEEYEVLALEAFLKALTDKNNSKGRLGRPKSIPSRLKFD